MDLFSISDVSFTKKSLFYNTGTLNISQTTNKLSVITPLKHCTDMTLTANVYLDIHGNISHAWPLQTICWTTAWNKYFVWLVLLFSSVDIWADAKYTALVNGILVNGLCRIKYYVQHQVHFLFPFKMDMPSVLILQPRSAGCRYIALDRDVFDKCLCELALYCFQILDWNQNKKKIQIKNDNEDH